MRGRDPGDDPERFRGGEGAQDRGDSSRGFQDLQGGRDIAGVRPEELREATVLRSREQTRHGSPPPVFPRDAPGEIPRADGEKLGEICEPDGLGPGSPRLEKRGVTHR